MQHRRIGHQGEPWLMNDSIYNRASGPQECGREYAMGSSSRSAGRLGGGARASVDWSYQPRPKIHVTERASRSIGLICLHGHHLHPLHHWQPMKWRPITQNGREGGRGGRRVRQNRPLALSKIDTFNHFPMHANALSYLFGQKRLLRETRLSAASIS